MEPEVTTEEVDFFVDEDEEDEWDWSKKWKLLKNTIPLTAKKTYLVWTVFTKFEQYWPQLRWKIVVGPKNTVCTVFLFFYLLNCTDKECLFLMISYTQSSKNLCNSNLLNDIFINKLLNGIQGTESTVKIKCYWL